MEIKNKRGRLTAYGLACGYVETKADAKTQTTLWHEGAVYHVRTCHSEDLCGWRVWESFDTLAAARGFFGCCLGRLGATCE